MLIHTNLKRKPLKIKIFSYKVQPEKKCGKQAQKLSEIERHHQFKMIHLHLCQLSTSSSY